MTAADIGRKVRETRERLSLSRKDVAEATGLSASYLGKIERGERPGSIAALISIAEALGVSLMKFVGENSEQLQARERIERAFGDVRRMEQRLADALDGYTPTTTRVLTLKTFARMDLIEFYCRGKKMVMPWEQHPDGSMVLDLRVRSELPSFKCKCGTVSSNIGPWANIVRCQGCGRVWRRIRGDNASWSCDGDTT